MQFSHDCVYTLEQSMPIIHALTLLPAPPNIKSGNLLDHIL